MKVEPLPEELWDRLVEQYGDQAGVSRPGEVGRRGFGSSALKINGSIFAMLTRGQLVVKLERHRVAALIEEGVGLPFDANKGTPMKEWLTVAACDEPCWQALTAEALEFGRRHAK
ncbi:MAG: TfoX/Sxy family protein [Actinomycetota bacterium]|nr:TfoX/Sxy family protein [Actinomycetota bacterium]